MSDLIQRRGVVLVSADTMQKMLTRGDTDIFGGMEFLIARTEYMFVENYIEYIGYSPEFDVVEQGVCAPRYELNLIERFEGVYTHELRRITDES